MDAIIRNSNDRINDITRIRREMFRSLAINLSFNVKEITFIRYFDRIYVQPYFKLFLENDIIIWKKSF
jgi:hypothetical protein